MTVWSVYFVRAAGGVIYTGIATDVDRRIDEHRAGRGAKYLRGRAPMTVVFRRRLGDRSLALRMERRLKRMKKTEKEALVRAKPSLRRLLAMLERSRTATSRSTSFRASAPAS
ncbi:MAG TPA: GIY-YIG nuclease family protein [Planctomycetota bacterium]|jgi:putative endonuclease|nr:GIY-YIG nuclease family protein [Planctomycetota bacterium]